MPSASTLQLWERIRGRKLARPAWLQRDHRLHVGGLSLQPTQREPDSTARGARHQVSGRRCRL